MKKIFLSFALAVSLIFIQGVSMKQIKPLVIILLGPPGAGKGTQAITLSKKTHLPHISTGDLFREHIQKETALGKKAQDFITKGQLVPDDLVIKMVIERIAQPDCKKGYILDGFPRTLTQAKMLDEHLKNKARVVALNLAVSDDVLVKRSVNRLVCKKCGASFHKIFVPPKEPNICDFCRGDLYQRADDKEDIIKKRLSVYHEETQPLIKYYQSHKDSFYEIASEGNKEEISENLLKSLKEIL